MPIQINENDQPIHAQTMGENTEQRVEEVESTVTPDRPESTSDQPQNMSNETQQPTNQPRPKRQVEIGIFGFGGMGNHTIMKLIDQLKSQNIQNIKYFGINSDDDDLELMRQYPEIQIVEFGDGFGMGMNAQAGYEAFKSSGQFETLRETIQKAGLILVITGFGGGTGTGGNQFFCEEVKKMGKPIIQLSVNPFLRDGEIRQERAKEWQAKMKELDYVNYDILIMDKIKEIHESVGSLTTQDITDICTLQVVNSVESLINVINTKNSVSNIDFADIRTALSGGRCLILTGKAKTLSEAINQALDQVKYREEQSIDNFAMSLINVRSKHAILSKDLDSFYNLIQSKAGKYLNKFGHDTQVDHEDVEVQLLLGGKFQLKEVKASMIEDIRARVARLSRK